MDYEVFTLARIREEYDATGSTDMAVVHGIVRTGRLVTSAALVLFLAFVAMATAPNTGAKMVATGLGAGILIDRDDRPLTTRASRGRIVRTVELVAPAPAHPRPACRHGQQRSVVTIDVGQRRCRDPTNGRSAMKDMPRFARHASPRTEHDIPSQ
jgi:hypothetical protein